MLKSNFFLTVCLLMVAGKGLIAQGSGHALGFTNSGDKPRLELNSAVQDSLDNSDFTVEFWLNVDPTISSDPSIISNKDWGSGNNTGWIIARQNSSGLKVNFKTPSAPRFDLNGITYPSSMYGEWHHVAIVFDRFSANPSVTAYVDGVQAGTGSLATNAPTATLIPTTPLGIYVGQDGTGTYGTNYMGGLDELRIWKTVRSQSDIQADMCQKLTGSESGLLVYTRLDDATGTTATDLAPAFTSHTITNSSGTVLPTWEVSGAAIGDESAEMYTTNWAGQSISLTSTGFGIFNADSVAGFEGVHVYRVDGNLNDSTGITSLNGNDTYFGVFAAGGTGTVTYDVNWSYASFPTAVAFENNMLMYERLANNSAIWQNANAVKDLASDVANVDSANTRGEYIFGNFIASCSAPSNLNSANTTFITADLSWTSGGSALWNIEYGPAGFTPGTGTVLTVNTNPYMLTGLTHGTAYEYYVQDSCANIGTSAWVGPHAFTTLTAPPCNAPSNLSAVASFSQANLSWTTGGSANWNVEYGLQGFTQGTGTMILNASQNPLTISPLMANTAYDFYVQDTCNQANASAWAGPFTFNTQFDFSNVGPGMGLDLNGQGYIDFTGNAGVKDTHTVVGLSDSSITVEAWVKAGEFQIWRSMVAFIQDNGNFERGWSLETRAGGKFAFGIATSGFGSIEYVETATTFNIGEWYHVAGIYDGDSVKVLVNGELEGYSTAHSGNIMYAPSWLSVGSYKDDNEDNRLDAVVDEVKIWNYARSYNEVRTLMCQKATGSESGLTHYYQFNDASGSGVSDAGPQNLDGVFQGSLDSTSAWVISGAAIGDESEFLHASNFSSAQLNLTSANRGNVSVDNISGALKGIHIYRVDSQPNSSNGINDLGSQNVYYGIYVSQDPNGNPSTYNVTYDYSNYTDAVTNEANLTLYNRNDASILNWLGSGANGNTGADQMELNGVGARRELILADFIAPSCPSSSNLTANNITATSANLSWTSGGGASFDLEYGTSGFSLGSGTRVNGLTNASYSLSGLNTFTQYDYYVLDRCSANDSSTWVGPFTFTTDNPCKPIDSIAVDSVSDNTVWIEIFSTSTNTEWDVQYGPTGFTLGLGLQSTLTGNPAELQGLFSNTTYDAYVRGNCDPIFSSWVGPLTFTTDSVSVGIETYNWQQSVSIFPNPSEGKFRLQLLTNNQQEVNFEVINMVGNQVYTSQFTSYGLLNESLDLSHLAKGVYMLRIHAAGTSTTKRLVIQ